MRHFIADEVPLLHMTVSLIVGIVAGFMLKASITLMPLFAGMVVLAFCLRRHVVAQTLALMAWMVLLGMMLAGRQWQLSHAYRYDEKLRVLRGVVASEPVEKPRSVAVDVLLTSNGRLLRCYVEKNGRSRRLKPGDGLRLMTRVRACTGAAYYQRYMEQHGYTGQCYVGDRQWELERPRLKRLSLLSRSRLAFLRHRHKLLERYRLQGAQGDSYAVLAAMTLGDKSALSKELRDTYSVTGASHILALSGLHLGILYTLLLWLTFGHRRRRIVSQALLVTGIWGFALLVGLPTSVVRSATMISLFAIFSIGHRPNMSFNLLCLAAIIILLQNPYALYDVGFQLSFMAVLSILMMMRMGENGNMESKGVVRRVGKALLSCIVVSVAAQIGTAPLVAYYFGRFPTYFLLTNLVVLPAAYLVLCGAALMLAVPAAAPLVIGIVKGLNAVLELLSRLPLASIEGLHPSLWQVLLFYILVASLYGALLVWKGRWPREKQPCLDELTEYPSSVAHH